MYVRDLMKPPVITVTADTGAGHALQMMREKIIRRVPVVDDAGRLVGIVNDRALVRLLSERRRHQTDPVPTVKMVMTSPVITTSADQPLEGAANMLATHRVARCWWWTKKSARSALSPTATSIGFCSSCWAR
ncbi:MAG: CBS domain-containing protein [Anaerolineae bacterium]|nr:MAG: CBS domain-containing protein [Anaerolineae bacterium]